MFYKNISIFRTLITLFLILSLTMAVYGCAVPSEDAVPVRESPREQMPEEEEEEGIHKISRAHVNLEVEDLEDSLQLLEKNVRDLGGFVSYSSVYRRDRDPSAQVTLRVPADNFYVLLDEIEEIGEVKHRSTSQEDVTRRYIDLEARINNLTSQEKRLTEIMEMADTVEEVLSVEKELERVRGEIESLTGEFNYLKSQVSMATIEVSLRETALATTGVTGIDFFDMFNRGYYAFIDSINAIIIFTQGFVILIMGAIPYIIILALLLIILKIPYSLIKEKRRKGKTPPPPPDKNVQS